MIWVSFLLFAASWALAYASVKQDVREGGPAAALLFMAGVLAFCGGVVTLAIWSNS